MKESGIGRENGVEAYLACVFLYCFPVLKFINPRLQIRKASPLL